MKRYFPSSLASSRSYFRLRKESFIKGISTLGRAKRKLNARRSAKAPLLSMAIIYFTGVLPFKYANIFKTPFWRG